MLSMKNLQSFQALIKKLFAQGIKETKVNFQKKMPVSIERYLRFVLIKEKCTFGGGNLFDGQLLKATDRFRI